MRIRNCLMNFPHISKLEEWKNSTYSFRLIFFRWNSTLLNPKNAVPFDCLMYLVLLWLLNYWICFFLFLWLSLMYLCRCILIGMWSRFFIHDLRLKTKFHFFYPKNVFSLNFHLIHFEVLKKRMVSICQLSSSGA